MSFDITHTGSISGILINVAKMESHIPAAIFFHFFFIHINLDVFKAQGTPQSDKPLDPLKARGD